MISSMMTARAGRLAGLVATSLVVIPVQAAPQVASGGPRPGSRQETIGFFSGLALGAAAGGPLGAVVGAGTGLWLGGRYHHELAENRALAARLHRSEGVRRHLDARAAGLAASLAASRAARAAAGAQLRHTQRLSDQLETEVAFRTDDASVERADLAGLKRLGALAASLPGVRVHIDGYADPRGPQNLNDDLSLMRAEAVALVLAQAGCPTRRLVIAGHGAATSSSPRGDLDAYAFDRRVTVRLERPDAAEVASRD